MPEISFKVSARTARLIGLENFANAEGAVIELIKNSYDADATLVIVSFDQSSFKPEEHTITILDNGSGMTPKIINDFWMLIGTDNKAHQATSDFARIRSGAKGIGRFALDKLGARTEMLTLTKGTNTGSLWKVNWDDFLIPNVDLSDIKATLDSVAVYNYKNEVLKYLTLDTNDSKALNNNKIENGTIIRISNLRDKWKVDDLRKLFGNLELLMPPKDQIDFQILMLSTTYPKEFGVVPSAYYDDFDYKIEAKTSENNDHIIDITITRNEFNLEQTLAKYPEFFSEPLIVNSGITEQSFRKIPTKHQASLSELVKGYADVDEGMEQLNKIGKFEFTCYFLKNSVSDESNENRYPYRNFDSGARKGWLKKFGGIKIFRDGFRVRPYGENGQDWLLLGERQAQSPGGAGQRIGGYRLRPNQVSGAINISRLSNLSFEDKSGREGIQENTAFRVFEQIIKNLIGQIEKDRNIVMYTISQLFKKKNKEAEAKRKADELAQQAIEAAEAAESNDKNNEDKPNRVDHLPSTAPHQNIEEVLLESEKKLNQTVLDLAKGFQAQKDEIQEKDDEIRLLRALAGTGLLVSSFSHELRNISPLLVTRVESLEKILSQKVNPKVFEHLKDYDQPLKILSDIKSQDHLIKHWLEYSLSALRKDKRTRTNINLHDYFLGYKSRWRTVLEKRQISLEFKSITSEKPILRGFVVDLDTIFNNLLTNSMEAFKRVDKKVSRIIKIELSMDENSITITFDDTGAGLSKDFKNPEDIFLPFETSKIDKSGQKTGTGIGMYLSKSIIEDYDGSIKIMRTSPGFRLEINLPLKYKRNGE